MYVKAFIFNIIIPLLVLPTSSCLNDFYIIITYLSNQLLLFIISWQKNRLGIKDKMKLSMKKESKY